MRGRTERFREERWKEGQASNGNHTTFFFSNFPGSHGEYDMTKIFQRWARVKDIFISRRLNRWGRRFGFVRFFDVENAARLEKKLDSIRIGNMKLFVNIPRYRRDGFEEKGRHNSERRNFIASNPVKNRSKAVWKEKKAMEEGRFQRGKHSYANAVRKTSLGPWKGPTVETKIQVHQWMISSVVGHMSQDFTFDLLCEEFIKGMKMIKLRYLGDNSVLLTPKEERMDDLIQLNKEWFESILESIEPWSESYVPSHKIVWVRCFGIPLPLWNKDCFSKVVGEEVELVYVDEVWSNLEFARLQVRVPNTSVVRISKGFWVNGRDTISVYWRKHLVMGMLFVDAPTIIICRPRVFQQ
ncbi:uncharacterized protein [Phaseolus vulgaris]|uniref:uncharacterized protein n=1 Tax=Phaseolus vulgaris TaxID=3885 RepID=UPI0035CB94C8